MNAAPADTRAATMRTLLAPAPHELSAHLAAGVNRLPAMLDQIRPDDPGAADWCERLAGQFDGLRLQAPRLGAALRNASEEKAA